MTGLLTIPAADYHADQIDDQRPSLSAGIANILINQSPAHAWQKHPRLNPDYQPDHETKWDIGQAVHAAVLEGNAEACCAVLNYKDWRTNAAQQERDEARAAGLIPLLAKDWDAVKAMYDATAAQLAQYDVQPTPFTGGRPEVTLVWEDEGVLCRARIDWLHDDGRTLDDFKSAHTANPERWKRGPLFDHGYDLQAAWYLRGLERVTGVRGDWRWVVVEKKPPYALHVFRPGADVLEVANAKVDAALRRWRECMESGVWPAYPPVVTEAELPPWADDAKWLVPEYVEEAA